MLTLLGAATATERSLPLSTSTRTRLFQGTCPARRPTRVTVVAAPLGAPLPVPVPLLDPAAAEPDEDTCVAATTAPATPSAITALAVMTAPRDRGRGSR